MIVIDLFQDTTENGDVWTSNSECVFCQASCVRARKQSAFLAFSMIVLKSASVPNGSAEYRTVRFLAFSRIVLKSASAPNGCSGFW